MILSKPSTSSIAHRRSSTAHSAAALSDTDIPEIVAPRQPGDLTEEPVRTTGLRLSVDRPEPGVVVVRMAGEIDLSCVPRLTELIRQRLTAAVLRGLVLDLTEVTFCSSAGLELMLQAQTRSEQRGIAMWTVCGRGAVRRLLDLTGIESRFDCRATVDEALVELR